MNDTIDIVEFYERVYDSMRSAMEEEGIDEETREEVLATVDENVTDLY